MQTTQAADTRRIAKNTLMLYVRMLFSMLVSLYTSRVVLNTLGVEDYGLYGVVGGFVGMFSLVSGSLSASTGRFLTFILGTGDIKKLKKVFSTSLSIHAALAAVIFILTETVGVWFLNTKMTIPPERLTAANWVFQASVLSFMLGLLSTPFNASIVSHEKMSAFAYIGMLEVVLRLAIVLFIAHSVWAFDRLTVYSLLLLGLSILIQVIYLLYCGRHFEECRLRFSFDREYWREMSSFAGWNFIGCSAALLKDQGVNVLFNLFVGPVLNAARGIASSVNAAVCSFAGNFMTALNPQITKSYAADERGYMFSLVERGSRFSFYIILVFALPLILEADFALALWLTQYPAHTVNFVRLILILSLCDALSNTLITLQTATGKIRDYQLAVGGMLLMNFPLSYLCLKAGLPPESTMIVAIVISVLCMLLRLAFLRKMAGLPAGHFLRNVCGNAALVVAAAAVIPAIVHCKMSYGWERFVTVSFISVASVCACAYGIGCSKSERLFIRRHAATAAARLIGSKRSGVRG